MLSLLLSLSVLLSAAFDTYESPEQRCGGAPVITKASRVLYGHKRPIHSVALSADGRIAAASSDDGNIRLWSTISGDLLFHRKENALSTLLLSRNGKSVVVFYRVHIHYRIQVWGIDGNLKWDYDHPETDIHGRGLCSSISSDGKTMAFCVRRDSEVKLVDMDSGRSQGMIQVNGPINALAFGEANRAIAIAYTSADSGTHRPGLSIVGLWNLKDLMKHKVISEVRNKNLHTRLRFAADDAAIAEIWNDQKVAQIRIESGKTVASYRNAEVVAEDVAFTSKNELLVLQRVDANVFDVWHLGNEKRTRRISANTDRVINHAILSNNASMVVGGMDDGTVALWSIQK